MLSESGNQAKYINFPDRSTDCGKLIDKFLTNKQEFTDETIHLLFSLNRWETKTKMENCLLEGCTLVVDRYSYSGVAYSAAKGNLKFSHIQCRVIYLWNVTSNMSLCPHKFGNLLQFLGLSYDWCKAPETGLLKPDLVLYLTLTPEAMAIREGFGNER